MKFLLKILLIKKYTKMLLAIKLTAQMYNQKYPHVFFKFDTYVLELYTFLCKIDTFIV